MLPDQKKHLKIDSVKGFEFKFKVSYVLKHSEIFKCSGAHLCIIGSMDKLYTNFIRVYTDLILKIWGVSFLFVSLSLADSNIRYVEITVSVTTRGIQFLLDSSRK